MSSKFKRSLSYNSNSTPTYDPQDMKAYVLPKIGTQPLIGTCISTNIQKIRHGQIFTRI